MKGSLNGFLKALCLSLAVLAAPFVLAQEDGSAPMPPETEQVNINRADAATIAEMLDGVGMARAEAIVDWREEYGEFRSLEDLTQVSGIGEATVRRNQEKIRFD